MRAVFSLATSMLPPAGELLQELGSGFRVEGLQQLGSGFRVGSAGVGFRMV